MKFFIANPVDGYEWVTPTTKESRQSLDLLNGPDSVQEWEPIALAPIWDPADNEHSDTPWLSSHLLVVRDRAMAALGDILSANGALVPLIGQHERLSLFVPRVLDALDEKRSEIAYFPGTTRILRVAHFAFEAEKLTGVAAFRLPDRPSQIFYGERFVQRYFDRGLVGLIFEEVWSG